jgi:hypothetical protein
VDVEDGCLGLEWIDGPVVRTVLGGGEHEGESEGIDLREFAINEGIVASIDES